MKVNRCVGRRLVLLIAIVMAMASATPASAKRPVPEPQPTVLYEVAFSLDGAEGLALCDGEPLLMRAHTNDLLADGAEGTSVPRLVLEAEVAWQRNYPTAAFGDRFEGCHGGALAESEKQAPSYFVLHSDGRGHIVGALWLFDLYFKSGTNGKDKIPEIKEFFRLWNTEATFLDGSGDGSLCRYDPNETTTCRVSGEFVFFHYYPIEEFARTNLSFSMTVTPVPSSG